MASVMDLMSHLQPRQARHVDVEKHHLRTMSLEHRQRAHAVGGGRHDPKVRPKDREMAAKLVAQSLLVFRDDRGRLDRRRRPATASAATDGLLYLDDQRSDVGAADVLSLVRLASDQKTSPGWFSTSTVRPFCVILTFAGVSRTVDAPDGGVNAGSAHAHAWSVVVVQDTHATVLQRDAVARRLHLAASWALATEKSASPASSVPRPNTNSTSHFSLPFQAPQV